jgi:hypothetical protein
VAELERKNLALERLTGPREVGLLDPDAEAEDEERAEIDLLEPGGTPSKGCLARMSGLLDEPLQTGKIRAQ